MPTDLKVLHITEALGGGITTALESFTKSTPDMSHGLVYAPRAEHDTGCAIAGSFDYVLPARSGPSGLSHQLARSVHEFRPDLVHVHATWAGFVTRARRLLMRRLPIAYSPHCFFFERTDIPAALSHVGRFVEHGLARATSLAICVSPHEKALAERLGMRAAFVPNVVDIAVPQRRERQRLVVTIGRLTAQKDPEFFAQAMRHAGPALRAGGYRVVWIGGGKPQYVEAVQDAGVEVLGWVARSRALELLAGAGLYVHSAAWEGNPMTLLEATALGVPVAARSIPALTSLGYPSGVDNPEQLARHVVDQLSAPSASASTSGVALPSRSDQAVALHDAYTLALSA